MKKIIVLAALAITVSGNAQSLKELLYSGKLKSDSGTVVHKSDDLSTKIDTSTRKKPVEVKTAIAALPADSLRGLDSSVTGTVGAVDSAMVSATAAPVNITRDNNKIWKDYFDSLTTTLRTEVLPSKKIKSGTYSVLMEFAIDLDGQTTLSSISCVPENSYLEQQIRSQLSLTSPQMTPLLNANGKPRKGIKKQTIVLAK